MGFINEELKATLAELRQAVARIEEFAREELTENTTMIKTKA